MRWHNTILRLNSNYLPDHGTAEVVGAAGAVVGVEVEAEVEGREEDVIVEFGFKSRSKFPKSHIKDFGPASGIKYNMW